MTRQRPAKPAGAIPSPRFKKEGSKAVPDNAPFDVKEWTGQINEAADDGFSFLDMTLDDTTAIITAATAFDRVLAILIVFNTSVPPIKKKAESVFRYPGPLSSFSSKIELCNLTGQITDEMKHDLDIIRWIRNEFCHSSTKRSFADRDIAEKCKKLKYSMATAPDSVKAMEGAFASYGSEGRTKFTVAALILLIFMMGFLYRRLAQAQVLDANQAKIIEQTTSKIGAFVDGIQSRIQAKAAGEQASAPPPPESNAPEKI